MMIDCFGFDGSECTILDGVEVPEACEGCTFRKPAAGVPGGKEYPYDEAGMYPPQQAQAKSKTKSGGKKMAKKDEVEVVVNEIPMKTNIIQVKIVGDSPLIVHAWSTKAKLEILEKQQKKAKATKELRDPVKEYLRAMYLLDETGNLITKLPEEVERLSNDSTEEEVNEVLSHYRFGFPNVAFKSAMIDTAYQQGLIAKKTTARGAIRIIGEYAVIKGFPVMREDMVMIGGISKVADLRYRPEFREWETVLNIEYLVNSVTPEQIYNWLRYAGFCGGVGEWRASRDGSFGSFHPEL